MEFFESFVGSGQDFIDKGSLALYGFEVAHHNQGVDGFADRGPPDTQHAGQITLGGKLGAGRQLTPEILSMICSATISGAELLRMVSKVTIPPHEILMPFAG
jgi:hypothetical protein